MANGSELLLSCNNLASGQAEAQELVSILKKSSGNSKRTTKASRDKIEQSKVVISDEDDDETTCQNLVLADIGEQTSVKVEDHSSPSSLPDKTKEPNVSTTTKPTTTQKKAQKPRRRVATVAQRRAANIRERRRMFNLNAAFDRLRKRVPSFAYEKRLSRIETLKLAIMYIRFMDNLVNDDAYAEKYKQLTSVSANNPQSSSAATSSFLASGGYLSLYNHRASAGLGTGSSNIFGLNTSEPSPYSRSSPGDHHPSSSAFRSKIESQFVVDCTTKQQQQQLQHGQSCEPSKTGSTINFSAATRDCQRSVGQQYYNETICPTSGQQQQQQQQQMQPYRAKALPNSPVSCGGSIACCSSPNSSSATTCNSVSSITTTSFNESSRSPTTVGDGQAGNQSANEAPSSYYSSAQQSYNSHSYAPPSSSSSGTARCFYPTGDTQQFTPTPPYYNTAQSLGDRKAFDSYSVYGHAEQARPLNASVTHQTPRTPISQHEIDALNQHYQPSSEPTVALSRQHYHHSMVGNGIGHSSQAGEHEQQQQQQQQQQHHQVYSLHSLEAI